MGEGGREGGMAGIIEGNSPMETVRLLLRNGKSAGREKGKKKDKTRGGGDLVERCDCQKTDFDCHKYSVLYQGIL